MKEKNETYTYNVEVLGGSSYSNDTNHKNDEIEQNSLKMLKVLEAKKVPEHGVFAGMIVVLIVVFFVSYLCVIEYNPMEFSAEYVFRNISANIAAFGNWIMGNGVSRMMNLMFRQYISIVMVGAALAAAGVMYKTIFRNVLAAPTTMGVQEGGILMNLVFIAIFGTTEAVRTSMFTENALTQSNFFYQYGQSIFIFVGCFVGVIAVWFIATAAGGGTLSTSAIILAGTVVNGAIAGINSSVQYNLTMNSNDDDLISILMRVTLGSFDYTYRPTQTEIMAITLIPSILLMFLFTSKMNIFALGDEEAESMGLNVKRFKWAVILLGAFMAGITMVFCGHIAFIGFIVPQIAQKMVGPDFRKQYAASILLGPIILLIVYDIAKVVGITDGISVITTMIGGLMLMYMLLKKKGLSRGNITR